MTPKPLPGLRKACDFCVRQKRGCDGGHPTCEQCRKRGMPCAYSRRRKSGPRLFAGKAKPVSNFCPVHDAPPPPPGPKKRGRKPMCRCPGAPAAGAAAAATAAAAAGHDGAAAGELMADAARACPSRFGRALSTRSSAAHRPVAYAESEGESDGDDDGDVSSVATGDDEGSYYDAAAHRAAALSPPSDYTTSASDYESDAEEPPSKKRFTRRPAPRTGAVLPRVVAFPAVPSLGRGAASRDRAISGLVRPQPPQPPLPLPPSHLRQPSLGRLGSLGGLSFSSELASAFDLDGDVGDDILDYSFSAGAASAPVPPSAAAAAAVAAAAVAAATVAEAPVPAPAHQIKAAPAFAAEAKPAAAGTVVAGGEAASPNIGSTAGAPAAVASAAAAAPAAATAAGRPGSGATALWAPPALPMMMKRDSSFFIADVETAPLDVF